MYSGEPITAVVLVRLPWSLLELRTCDLGDAEIKHLDAR